jgi:small subunit ribosomal protein S17
MSPETREQAKPARTQRATETGVVTSSGRQKTIAVTVTRMVRHAKYGKFIRRQTILHAHDEKNDCHNGDVVEIVQTRPLSKTKCWRLLRIVSRGHEHPSGLTGGGA